MVADDEKIETVDALIEVYSSFISSKIDDYNSSVIMKILTTFLNAIRKIRCYKEYGCRMLVSDEEKPTWKKKL